MSISNSTERFENEVSNLSDSKARKRLAMLFDNGTYNEVDRFLKNEDDECEVVTAFGEVNGLPTYAFAQSIDVNKGAMGKVQASKINHIYDMALKTGCAVVGIFDSFGAHINEGVDALEAYGSIIKAAGNLSGVVPQISVIAGTCVGSAAVLASLSDVIILEKDSEFYITSSSEETGSATLFAEDDSQAMQMVVDVLSYLPSNNLSEPLFADYLPACASDDAMLGTVDCNSFLELNKESGKSIVTGFARIGGAAVGVVKTTSKETDGYFCSCAAKKAAHFVRLCDAFSLPIITFVDSNGLNITEECEKGSSVKAVSMLTSAYSEATTAKISIITGNAIGAAYIAFVSSASNPDLVYAWPQSVIGNLEPMTAVQFSYKDRLEAGEDRKTLEEEYKTVACSPFNAAAKGYVNDIIEPEQTAAKLISSLTLLSSKRVTTLSKKHSNIPL
ncbi:MAG: carboxyl transferase [Clostridia bacterium]|nr:carboxyl transferase [Clostridia bacterium]